VLIFIIYTQFVERATSQKTRNRSRLGHRATDLTRASIGPDVSFVSDGLHAHPSPRHPSAEQPTVSAIHAKRLRAHRDCRLDVSKSHIWRVIPTACRIVIYGVNTVSHLLALRVIRCLWTPDVEGLVSSDIESSRKVVPGLVVSGCFLWIMSASSSMPYSGGQFMSSSCPGFRCG